MIARKDRNVGGHNGASDDSFELFAVAGRDRRSDKGTPVKQAKIKHLFRKDELNENFEGCADR